MCGIIGLIGVDDELNSVIFSELLIQSQIRGKHATGISFIKSYKIKTIKEPLCSKDFVKKHKMFLSNKLIGHTRYSTSSLEYNQPISSKIMSIVHNGIITQESPKDWEKHFNLKNFETKNDSEILFKIINDDPFLKFPDASIACGILTPTEIQCFRNFTRPLWIFENKFFKGFASTEDIIKRTFSSLKMKIKIYEAEPFFKYIIFNNEIKKIPMKFNLNNSLFKKDQQVKIFS